MNLGCPINKSFQYDNRERISEFESIMAVFLLTSGRILYFNLLLFFAVPLGQIICVCQYLVGGRSEAKVFMLFDGTRVNVIWR